MKHIPYDYKQPRFTQGTNIQENNQMCTVMTLMIVMDELLLKENKGENFWFEELKFLG